MHSNDDWKLSGNFNYFDELVTFYGDDEQSGEDNIYNGGLDDNDTIYDWPLTAPAFNIDHYKPGGIYSSDPEYPKYTSSTVDIALSGPLEGIYYSAGKITLSDPVITGNVTLVAEDEINLSGNQSTLYPYINNLLAFGKGEECGAAAISFSGNENVWNGIVYSPYGMIYMSGNANEPNTLDGCLWGARVILSGEAITVQNCADYVDDASLVSLVE